MGDLGNVIEVTQIGGRRADRLMARKLSSSNFGLLQQYLPKAAFERAQTSNVAWDRSEAIRNDRGRRNEVHQPGCIGRREGRDSMETGKI